MNFTEKKKIVEKIQKLKDEDIDKIIDPSNSQFDNIRTKNDILLNFNLFSENSLLYMKNIINTIDCNLDTTNSYSVFHYKKTFKSSLINFLLSYKIKEKKILKPLKKIIKKKVKKVEKKVVELDSEDNSVYEYFSHYYEEIGNDIKNIDRKEGEEKEEDYSSTDSSESYYSNSSSSSSLFSEKEEFTEEEEEETTSSEESSSEEE